MDILELALAFHRNPLRYQEHVRFAAGLPANVGELLKVAAHQHEHAPGHGDDGPLQHAARFFIEQVLLAPGADYYRVLGVNPSAPLARIKDHHRLLMRLFHPDRGNTDRQWTDVYSRRINQAYTVLRKPHTRSAYDRTLNAARARMTAGTRVYRQTPPSTGRETPKLRLPRSLQRLTPARLLWTTAVLALLFIAQVYRVNDHPRADGGAPAVNPPEIAPVGFEQLAPPMDSPPSALLADTVRQALRELSVVAPVTRPAAIDPKELSALLNRFVAHYERGELEPFMALFSASASLDWRRGYERLFRLSQARRIEVSDLRWRPRGALQTGDGRYRAVVHEGDLLKTYVGNIYFEVEARTGKPLINTLRFSVERQSSATGEERRPATLTADGRWQ
ncbi:MAG: J domain-containing protein [Gammaproteobacteria bacterium]